MKRTTAKDIMQIQKVINTELKGQKKTERVSVEWAYGQPRAYLRGTDGKLIGPLSPRLRTGRMLDWLYAFEVGLRMGYPRMKTIHLIAKPCPSGCLCPVCWEPLTQSRGIHYCERCKQNRPARITCFHKKVTRKVSR